MARAVQDQIDAEQLNKRRAAERAQLEKDNARVPWAKKAHPKTDKQYNDYFADATKYRVAEETLMRQETQTRNDGKALGL